MATLNSIDFSTIPVKKVDFSTIPTKKPDFSTIPTKPQMSLEEQDAMRAAPLISPGLLQTNKLPPPNLNWSVPELDKPVGELSGRTDPTLGRREEVLYEAPDRSLKELFFGTQERRLRAEAAAKTPPEGPTASALPMPPKGTPILYREDERPWALKKLGVSSAEEWAEFQQALKAHPVTGAMEAGRQLTGFPVALSLSGPIVGSLLAKLGAIPKVGEWMVANEATALPAIQDAIKGAAAGVATRQHEQTIAEAGLGGAVINTVFGQLFKQMPPDVKKEVENVLKPVPAAKPTVEGISAKHEIVAKDADTGLPIVKMLKEVREEVAVPEFKAVAPKPLETAPLEAKPLEAPGKPATPAENENRFKDFIGRRMQEYQDEQKGQYILDLLDERGVSPSTISDEFWSTTYASLPEYTKKKFQRYLSKLTGFSPGDVIGTTKSGENIVPKTWEELGSMWSKELGREIEYLEGTERGYTVLMAVGNDVVKTAPKSIPEGSAKFLAGEVSQPPIEPPAAAPGALPAPKVGGLPAEPIKTPSLEQEALKYKTAEEFVRAQGEPALPKEPGIAQEPAVTMESLKKDPKLSSSVLKNPEAHSPELVAEAQKLYRPDHQWRIGEGLKAVTEKRTAQEALYSREKGMKLNKGLAEAARIRAAGGTEEEAYNAQLSALKGELTKVEYEAFKGKTSQDDFNMAFKDITNSTQLTEWEKITAKRGFKKMWEGKAGELPQENEIELLKQVFPADMIDAVLKNKTTLEKFRDAGYQVANLPRAMMSSFDFSFGLRQGIFIAARHPVMFAKAEKAGFKAMFSESEYQEIRQSIRENPKINLAQQAELSLTDLKKGLGNREEPYMASIAEKVPGVRASARHYTTMANKLRMDLFSSLTDQAEAVSKAMMEAAKTLPAAEQKAAIEAAQMRSPTYNIDVAKKIASYVNNATGRGDKLFGTIDIGRQAKALNALFFSPRLMASRTTLITKLADPRFYLSEDPIVRKEYLTSLGAMMSSTLTILGAAKLAGAEVGADPRSSDFGKIIVGNTRIDIMGGFQQYIRAAGQLGTGEYVSSVTGKKLTLGEGYKPITRYDILLRQIEAKEAPVASLITSWLKQQTPQGEPVSLPKEIANRFIPMVVADAVELYKDNPELLPLVILGAAGVGLQTYEPKPMTMADRNPFQRPKFKRPWEK